MINELLGMEGVTVGRDFTDRNAQASQTLIAKSFSYPFKRLLAV